MLHSETHLLCHKSDDVWILKPKEKHHRRIFNAKGPLQFPDVNPVWTTWTTRWLKETCCCYENFAPIVPRHHIFTSVILIPNRAGFLASSQSRLKNNLIVLTANWVKCTRSAESTGSCLSVSVCVSKKTSPSCKHRFLGLARVQKSIRRKN